jgi:di/tricarboxylate transporter
VADLVVTRSLLAIVAGLAIATAGVGFGRYGSPVTEALNRLYSTLPGRFVYPMWFHKIFGGMVALFGFALAAVGVITLMLR